MALWKEATKSSSEAAPDADASARFNLASVETPDSTPSKSAPERVVARQASHAESMIAPDITIEGKIQGSGHVRIAGRFEGDVNVDGDLSIEPGAVVTGSVRAHKVTVAGELVGNIEAATHVDLLSSGALSGDLKAGSLAVAAGSRMRGQAEFGWDAVASNVVNKPAGFQSKAAKHAEPGLRAEGDNTVQ
ncbi:MAG: polymer-forming cytoskeletal protein [Xanthomonadales bacterium]|nr:polymer-forming cytoskeletal protein [Xanthomonadales bacterium]